METHLKFFRANTVYIDSQPAYNDFVSGRTSTARIPERHGAGFACFERSISPGSGRRAASGRALPKTDSHDELTRALPPYPSRVGRPYTCARRVFSRRFTADVVHQRQGLQCATPERRGRRNHQGVPTQEISTGPSTTSPRRPMAFPVIVLTSHSAAKPSIPRAASTSRR